MENLRSISGELPYVRIGGTPQDIVEWNSSQKEAQIAVWPNNDLNQNPTGLSLGPSFVDSFGGFPKDTKYIFGLTFGSVNASGLQNTLMEAKAVFDALQGSLYAFEIGNEPECELISLFIKIACINICRLHNPETTPFELVRISIRPRMGGIRKCYRRIRLRTSSERAY